MTYNKRELIAAIVYWPQERIERGFEPHLLTFMFNPLPGSASAKNGMMAEEVTATYYKLLTRHFRHLNNIPIDGLPMWICCPDVPVHKNNVTATLNDQKINEGLHYHVVALVPPKTRIKQNFSDYVISHRDKFVGHKRYINRIDAKPVDENIADVTDYVLKGVKSGKVDYDDVLLLPKSKAEQPVRTKAMRLDDRIEGRKRRRY